MNKKIFPLELSNNYSKIINDSDKNNNSNLIQINDLITSLEHGDLSLIKNAKYGEINFKECYNNNSVLHYAIKHGDTSFLKYAFKLGARIDTTNNIGNTLLEYACLEQDPNMIQFLGLYGANIQKHLFFREGDIKYINNNDSIDIAILLKIIVIKNSLQTDYKCNQTIYNKIKTIKKLVNLKEKININEYTFSDLFNGLYILLNTLPEENALNYLNIINEELLYILQVDLGCPHNKLEIILINIIPFIEYPFNISLDWVIMSELKFVINNIINKNNKINSIDIKKYILNNIWDTYIENEIIQENYLGSLIYQLINKNNFIF